MRRCVVNVSTGHYLRGQARMRRVLSELDPDSRQQFWSEIPASWPSHTEKPYAFKAYALMEAAQNADLLLWADAAVLPLHSLQPLWQRIESDGYWLALNGWTNYEWTADSAYADLFPGVPIPAAREINKTFPQVVATAFGLNLRSRIGRDFLTEYYRLGNTNAFPGPWANANCESMKHRYPANSCYTTKPCGPPDVLGHRHDQTAASVVAWRLGMELSQCGLFAYPPPGDNTILLKLRF